MLIGKIPHVDEEMEEEEVVEQVVERDDGVGKKIGKMKREVPIYGQIHSDVLEKNQKDD